MWDRGVDVPARAKAKPPPHPDRAPGADRRRRPLPGQAHRGRHGPRLRRHLPRRPRGAARRRALARARRAALARVAAAPDRRPPQRRALGGRVHGRDAGRWEWTIEAWIDLFATWRDELARKVDVGQPDLSGRAQRGRRAPARRRRARQRRGRAPPRRPPPRRSPPTPQRRARPGAARAVERSRSAPRRTELARAARARRRPRAGALRLLVRALPALVGRLQRRRGAAARASPSWASTSSTCRRSTRSGAPTARAATTR